MAAIYWIYFIAIPAFIAWKKRSCELGVELFTLFGTMLSAFLGVWCEPRVAEGLDALLAGRDELKAWAACASVLMIWLIVFCLFKAAVNKIAPGELEGIHFPERLTRFLVPLTVFCNAGLICALLFTALSLAPLPGQVSFITQDKGLCSATRYRMLWNSFLIDRFSWQPVSVTARRRAFDRFVPEDPYKVRQKAMCSSDNRKGK